MFLVYFEYACFFLRGVISLRISKFDSVADYSGGKRFRFAIIDLDRGKEYPVNFICLLPLQLKPEVNL